MVLAEKFFAKITDRERCMFECGIKLGSIFHQFVGTPVSLESKESLEKAIEEAVKNQPFVEDVEIKIDEKYLESGYATLDGKMLDVRIVTRFKNSMCRCRIRYIKDYPLMYVEEIRG